MTYIVPLTRLAVQQHAVDVLIAFDLPTVVLGNAVKAGRPCHVQKVNI